MPNINQTFERLARMLASCGFNVSVAKSFSNVSRSRYIEASTETKIFKIRISDHELPVYYQPADYELNNEDIQAFGNLDKYPELVSYLCEVYAMPQSPQLKRVLSLRKGRDEARARAREEMTAAKDQREREDMQIALPIYLQNKNSIDDSVEKIEGSTGQKRRKLRSAFNQKWREVCSPEALRQHAKKREV